MKRTSKKSLHKRLFRFCLLGVAVVVVYVLANIPVLAEYFFARGITRGIGWLISRVTNYIPVSLYEWTAVLLIMGVVALVVYFIVLLSKKRFARAGVCLYRLGITALSVLFAFGCL